MTESSLRTIDETVKKMEGSFRAQDCLPLSHRASQLCALRRMLRDNAEELCSAVHKDLGKPREETLMMEIGLVINEINYVLPRMRCWAARHYLPSPWTLWPACSWTKCEPEGVALIVSPWNYPILLSLEPMVDAIAAGCPVILKPSDLSPNTSEKLEELLGEYMDENQVQVLQGGRSVNQRLLTHHFGRLFFTGGKKVGSILMQLAAKTLTPVTLELGGKSPCYVGSSCKLRAVARRIAWGKFINAGQTCVAPDYCLTTKELAGPLAEEIGKALEKFFGPDPRESGSYGRIINEKQLDRLISLLPSSDPLAGTLAVGGGFDKDDLYLAPTVLLDSDPGSKVMQEEIFGPILPIVCVEDAVGAIDFINDRPSPLALYVFERNPKILRMFEKKTQSGSLEFNVTLTQLSSSRLPFGGIGASGMGHYHGKAGFLEFSHTKSVMEKPLWPETLRFVMPPYDKLKDALVSVVSKTPFKR
ncbi:MAG: aldehyde dehydrogenase family protein [Aeriscardovia sp.]|nr:aldehyde dehydrogenase family protein [Aeriscardovia sp.]